MKHLNNSVYTAVLNVNAASYCILFTITLCVNKFILSSFKFSYPTVLQGWQTMTTSLFIFLLKTFDKEKFKESVHAPGILIFFPHLLFHVFQLVTGSKALSLLPVPVFLCGINSFDALINLILKSKNRLRNLLACFIIIVSGFIVLWKYYEFTKVGTFVWFFTYLLFFFADSLYCAVMDMKVNRLSKLFYINLFSVVTLLPLSIISKEVYSALEFSSGRGFWFHLSFLLSGVSAGMTQVQSLSLHSKKLPHLLATALASGLAHIIFIDEQVAHPLFYIILVSLVTNFLYSQDDSSFDHNILELDTV